MSLRRIVLALLGALLVLSCLFVWGRSLWHPVYVRLAGGTTVGQVMATIARTRPELQTIDFSGLTLLALKGERKLHAYRRGTLWRSFDILAASGKPGPKLEQGDYQVPEGVYTIDAINPNSSYHLSLRVSYPNALDRARSAAKGIEDLGGDIYIHGKAVSIGCLAMGDDAIEQIFYAVVRAGGLGVPVIIAPAFDNAARYAGEDGEMYRQIDAAIASHGCGRPAP
jgi:hypothetical protein